MGKGKFLFGVALALASALPVVGRTAVPFPVGEAKYATVPAEESADALVEAVNRSTVSAQTSGEITELNYDANDMVKQGQVLLRIRDTEQRAAVTAAQARFKEAQAEFKRISGIYKRKLVSKSAYDKAEAALKSARAALDQAREQLGYTVVEAPYSGVVVKRFVQLGESVHPGQPLMTGLSLEQLRVVADVPQRYIDTIRHLKRATVVLDGDGEKTVEGTRVTVIPLADAQSHTFKVRVALPDGVSGIFPGMFAKVRFPVGEERRLLVPKAAVVHRSEVTGVYVVDANGNVDFRYVREGRTLPDGRIEILAGLENGEQVALDPIRAGIYLKERAPAAAGGSHE